MRSAWLLAAMLSLAACTPLAAEAPIAEQWRSLEVRAEPVAFPQERAGQLVFRGGLALSSDHPWFGGLSGLEVLEDGRFIAHSDDGDWFQGRLVLDESGALTGVADMRVALMRDEQGEPFQTKDQGDSEDIAQLPDGRFVVSFEQTQMLRLYDLNRDGPFGAAQPGPPLAETERLPSNVGLEAVASDGADGLLVGAEGTGATTPLWHVRLDSRTPTPPSARYRYARGYALTSLDRLPDGGFVALERFFAPVIAPRARITRFSDAALAAGGVIEPEQLARLSAPMPVDNFEGVSAVRGPNGATRLYIVSDDNFSRRQRTLLLAFDLPASAPSGP